MFSSHNFHDAARLYVRCCLSSTCKNSLVPVHELHCFNYMASGRIAKYCGQRVCTSVCLFVPICLSARISQKLHVQILPNHLYVLSVAVARFASDDNVISYVLPVLWITSCFHTMGHMVRGVGNVDVCVMLYQVDINFQRIRQRAPRCLTLLSYLLAANCAPGAKSVVYNCLVATCFSSEVTNRTQRSSGNIR